VHLNWIVRVVMRARVFTCFVLRSRPPRCVLVLVLVRARVCVCVIFQAGVVVLMVGG
jgi:hypothetical protein